MNCNFVFQVIIRTFSHAYLEDTEPDKTYILGEQMRRFNYPSYRFLFLLFYFLLSNAKCQKDFSKMHAILIIIF